MAVFIFTLYALHFFYLLDAHALCSHASILRAVSLVSQNLYVEYLIQIHVFLATKYASFGHSAYFRNHF